MTNVDCTEMVREMVEDWVGENYSTWENTFLNDMYHSQWFTRNQRDKIIDIYTKYYPS